MPLIQLNIRYDPEYPFDWVPEYEAMQARFPENKKPLFPYSWRHSGVVIGPWVVEHKRVHTRGFDPYSGDEWELRTKYFGFRFSSLISFTFEVTFRSKVADWRWSWFKDMPWPLRKLWSALEYREDWYMHNEYVEDPMGNIDSYE